MTVTELEMYVAERLENARRLYLEAIGDGNYEQAINTYAGQRYTQHSTPVKDGKAGFIEFFADFVNRNPIRDIEILRAFEDGPYVFLHVLQTLNNGEFRYVTADIFETDDRAKLIEHWDIIAEVGDLTPSGHSQIDGPSDSTDLDKTEENKTLVRRYLSDVLGAGRHDQIAAYVSADVFVQHSLGIADGIDGFLAHIDRLAVAGEPLAYLEVHNVIGSGNFVASLSEVHRGNTPLAVIDLFRLEDGRIAEHWDVTEHITPSDTWVNSGKF